MSEVVHIDKSTYEKLVAAANQMQQPPGAVGSAQPAPAPTTAQPQPVVVAQPSAPVQPAWGYSAPQAGPGMFGLPQQPAWAGGVWTGPLPQPTGVSVPVTVPLPDGRELSVRVHFGPEAAVNLQAIASQAAQMFGSWLQARNGWSQRNYSNRRRSW